jgi:hypothetical protein
MLKPEYIPGVCNIGPAERSLRRKVGWIGSGITIALWAVLLSDHTPRIWRLFIFLPAAMAAVGFLQSAFHFCAAFGLKGLFNFGSELGKTDTVMQAEFRKKDRQRAWLILFLSVMTGMITAAAAYLTGK